MSNFDNFLKNVEDGTLVLAKELFDGFENEAKEDAQFFLTKMNKDLQYWTKLLGESEITKEDFADLVQAKQALAEIHSLRQKGVALTKLEKFRSGLIDLVIKSASDKFL